MKTTILTSIIALLLSSIVLSQDENNTYIPAPRTFAEFEYGGKFATKQDTSEIESFSFGLNHVIKNFNWGDYQVGLAYSKRFVKLKEVPVNNVNEDISFNVNFIQLKNTVYFNFYKEETRTYSLYSGLNLGYGLKRFKREEGKFNLDKAFLTEITLGAQALFGEIYLKVGLAYSNYNHQGKFITDHTSLSDIDLNLKKEIIGFQFTIGSSLNSIF